MLWVLMVAIFVYFKDLDYFQAVLLLLVFVVFSTVKWTHSLHLLLIFKCLVLLRTSVNDVSRISFTQLDTQIHGDVSTTGNLNVFRRGNYWCDSSQPKTLLAHMLHRQVSLATRTWHWVKMVISMAVHGCTFETDPARTAQYLKRHTRQ